MTSGPKLWSSIAIIISFTESCAFAAEETLEEYLIQKNRDISYWIDEQAEAIDLYLAEKSYSRDRNGTRISASNSIYVREGAQHRFVPNLSARVHLPHTERKWQLAFATYDEESQDQGINRSRKQTENNPDSVGAFLEIMQEFGSLQTKFEPRLQYSDELESKFRLQLYSTAKTNWLHVKPELHFFANPEDGTGIFTSLELKFLISYDQELEIVNEQQYSESKNTLFTNHGPKYTIVHSDSITTQYGFIIEADNRPNYHATSYTISGSFRHKIYRNVFHYDIEPFINWSRSEEFRKQVGLNLEMKFIF
ncbi:hypothetical protein [Pseudobacteriovorax antillogorgiicola]|uniref:Uncharacterized protein n=1 Tax=Pseudobacteriovorax antillogorgiicola TaxID=1513793 RepID=A0A1Y6CIZ3_9BACT|nr:hypothetical protein [Pseudobacteriovorax antillogorgiicola]TCS47010.1 hypothetical protein EDD56_122105 [Pseudobacteriovorax antillogorgiicola]SMF65037.1 hypothetical protein SAMN06296036_122105 [Pseudobacteriovorax antillogorgiicola]